MSSVKCCSVLEKIDYREQDGRWREERADGPSDSRRLAAAARESGSDDDPSTGRDPSPVSPLGPRRGNESSLTYCTDGASTLHVRRWTLSLRHPTPQTNPRACQSSPSCPTRSCSKSSGTPPSCTRTESNDRLPSGGWSRTSGWLAGDCGMVRPSRLNHLSSLRKD